MPGPETVLVGWLRAGRTPVAAFDPLSGRYRLTDSRRYRWTTAVFALLAAALGVAAATWRFAFFYYVIFGPLGAFFFYAFHDAFFVKIAFSDASLFLERGHPVFVPWGAVTKAKHIGWRDMVTFKAPNLPRIRVSLDGLLTLSQCAGDNLPPGLQDNLSVMRQKISIHNS